MRLGAGRVVRRVSCSGGEGRLLSAQLKRTGALDAAILVLDHPVESVFPVDHGVEPLGTEQHSGGERLLAGRLWRHVHGH